MAPELVSARHVSSEKGPPVWVAERKRIDNRSEYVCENGGFETSQALTDGCSPFTNAAAVAGPIANVDEIVRSLARDALIHVERRGASRLNFRLLRTVRDLAAEGLDQPELAATQALHRRWHADLSRGTGSGHRR